MGQLVSIIIPSYNYGNYLPCVLDSLFKQSYSNWECLIIDDGSIDDTKQVAEKFCKDDPRIKYFFQTNSGPAAARNLGIKNCSGEFIQFIDADDLIGSEKFTSQIKIFTEDNNLDVVYSNYVFTNEQLIEEWKDAKKWQKLSNEPFKDFIKYWEAGLMIPIHSFLFRKSCFDRFGSFDEKLKTHEDWDLNLNFSMKGARYFFHDYKGAYYRIHSGSSTRSDLTLNRKDALLVLIKYLKDQRLSFSQKVSIADRYFVFFADFAVEHLLHNRMNFFKVISNGAGVIMNGTAFILFPFYLIRKIVKRIMS